MVPIMPLSVLKKMLYTFLLESTAFPLDLARLEMEGPWIQTWTKVGKVLAVLDWGGEALHGDADASKQVPSCGGHYLWNGGVSGYSRFDSCSLMTVQEPTQSRAVCGYSPRLEC